MSPNPALFHQQRQPPPIPGASGTPLGVLPFHIRFIQARVLQTLSRLSISSEEVPSLWQGDAVFQDSLSGQHCDPCSLPGFPGPKPALISWMEQESEAWSSDAQDPEEGESLGGALRGEGLSQVSSHPP